MCVYGLETLETWERYRARHTTQARVTGVVMVGGSGWASSRSAPTSRNKTKERGVWLGNGWLSEEPAAASVTVMCSGGACSKTW